MGGGGAWLGGWECGGEGDKWDGQGDGNRDVLEPWVMRGTFWFRRTMIARVMHSISWKIGPL